MSLLALLVSTHGSAGDSNAAQPPPAEVIHCAVNDAGGLTPQILEYHVNGKSMIEVTGDKLMKRFLGSDATGTHYGYTYQVLVDDSHALEAVGYFTGKDEKTGNTNIDADVVMIDKDRGLYLQTSLTMENLFPLITGARPITTTTGSCELG